MAALLPALQQVRCLWKAGHGCLSTLVSSGQLGKQLTAPSWAVVLVRGSASAT